MLCCVVLMHVMCAYECDVLYRTLWDGMCYVFGYMYVSVCVCVHCPYMCVHPMCMCCSVFCDLSYVVCALCVCRTLCCVFCAGHYDLCVLCVIYVCV